MLDTFIAKIKVIFKSPIIIFIYSMIINWYVMVMFTAVIVVFWVLKGLVGIGFIDKAQKVVFNSLQETKSVAKHCVPKIMNFSEFWYCLQNTPEYEATQEEKDLEKAVTNLLDFNESEEEKDPYSN